jgi:hypothetical protein
MTKKKLAKGSTSSTRAAKNPFSGLWRITWMEQWDQEFVNEEVEGFFDFEPDGLGSFHFGFVRGQIDYRLSMCEGQPRLEFSWNGNDEMDPAQGRGWATADGDQIDGMLFFHQGNESKFKAVRLASIRPRRRKRLRWTNLRSK